VIEAEKATYTVKRMCDLLGVSRSGFYKWRVRRDRGPSPLQRRRAELDAQVAASHAASDGVYGAPRVLADLRADGRRVSRKTVAASLRRCAGSGWPGSARGDSRRPPRWSTWTRRYRRTW
jgi:putative transposase